MTLARAAADRALDDIAAPPQVAAIPGSAAGAIARAQDDARRRAPNHGKLFAHLTRAIRQTILLKAHLAEGRATAPRTHTTAPGPATPTSPDPRSDGDTPRRETLDRLDCRLPTGPDGEVAVDDLLRVIASQFGLDSDQPAPPDADRSAIRCHPPAIRLQPLSARATPDALSLRRRRLSEP